MTGFLKTVSKNSRPSRALFLAFSKVDDLKIILSFLYFSLLHGLEAAVRSWEIKVHVGYLWEIIDTVFINLVIYKLQEHRVKITLDAFVQN